MGRTVTQWSLVAGPLVAALGALATATGRPTAQARRPVEEAPLVDECGGEELAPFPVELLQEYMKLHIRSRGAVANLSGQARDDVSLKTVNVSNATAQTSAPQRASSAEPEPDQPRAAAAGHAGVSVNRSASGATAAANATAELLGVTASAGAQADRGGGHQAQGRARQGVYAISTIEEDRDRHATNHTRQTASWSPQALTSLDLGIGLFATGFVAGLGVLLCTGNLVL
mmetsp:Transcript_79949/g.226183  ORF Transcript_79949/g.226183 Transcript_79949/m.226183 type:complete len:229 (-) Transcript_79949:66-752(-)